MAFQILKTRPTQPVRNTVYAGLSFDDRQRFISQEIMRRIKQTPELIGILDTVVTDHFQGQVDFFTPDGKVLGPTKLKQVTKFWQEQKVIQAFYGQGVDYFSDGSSFGWYTNVANLLTSKQKEQIVKLKQLNYQAGMAAEESSNLPRAISYLAASTTEIKHDEFGEICYIQDTSGKVVRWNPDQVVHIKLMEFNGEIRSFSGLKALTKEIVLMYMLKENMIAKMQNGGSPDYIIGMKNANGLSRGKFERLRTAIESFSHLKKSHGNMPIDADVTAIPLGAELKDMEYRELAMFILSEFCLAVGVPTSRIPFLMTGSGGTTQKGQMSTDSEDAYQKKINNRRLAWENEWNEIFKRSGFIFRFRRTNLQDEVRETQASTQRAAYVLSTQDVLLKNGKELTDEAMLQLLSGTKMNIAMSDIQDASKDKKESIFPNKNPINQNDIKANVPKKDAPAEAVSKFRTQHASNNGVSA